MRKPSLLLSACCAPCATVAIERLKEEYDITILYWGDNMDREEEFNKRLNELYKIWDKVIVKEYDHTGWQNQNCQRCWKLRLEYTNKIAEEQDFDFFATTLTTSPHKPADVINKIGESLSPKYLATNFKKQNGFVRSVELSKQLGLYRQNYCGCVKT